MTSLHFTSRRQQGKCEVVVTFPANQMSKVSTVACGNYHLHLVSLQHSAADTINLRAGPQHFCYSTCQCNTGIMGAVLPTCRFSSTLLDFLPCSLIHRKLLTLGLRKACDYRAIRPLVRQKEQQRHERPQSVKPRAHCLLS